MTTTWNPTDPATWPPGWQFEPVAGAWQQWNEEWKTWELAEPPAEAFTSVRDQSAESDQRSAETGEPDAGRGLWSPRSLRSHAETPWPTLDPAAFHGIAGRVVTTLGPHTEADPAALDDLAGQVGRAVERAYRVGTLTRSPDARELWAKAYEDFGDGAEGLTGAVTARAEAQALRLSVAYAVLDGSETIEVEHLEAALAAWRYCEQSAALIFGDALGDPIADRLLSEIRDAGDAGLDGTGQRDIFGRHASGARLDQARAALEAKGLIVTVREETGGRPRLVSRAVGR